MNNITTEENYNVQFQEVAEQVTQAKKHLASLEKQLKKLYQGTTQHRLEQEQKQLREECYYCECHLSDKATTKLASIPVRYTIIKKPTKQ